MAFAMAAPAPASAQLARPLDLAGIIGKGDLVQEVQWRGRRGGRRGGSGAALGIGIATGALIGGAIAAQSAPRYYDPPRYYYGPPPAVVVEEDEIEYCMSRFRSYDPRSGTYMGYDGIRRPCP